jgi:predicted transcriptional regulator
MENAAHRWWVRRNAVIVDGAKLTDARLKAGLRLIDVARRLGTGKGTVSKWELETTVPSEERIEKMVKMLGTNSFVRVNPNYRPLGMRKKGKS